MKKAIVTGSFDPITLGHLELVKYASSRYDVVYVVALINEKKTYMYTLEEKKKIIELSLQDFDNVVADAYEGMTSDYMHKQGITHIIRGIRSEKDLEYERELKAQMKACDPNFETIIIECTDEFRDISSTLVRNAILNNESLDGLVHKNAISYIKSLKNNSKKANC